MIFHFNDKGEPIGLIPERIIQGSVGAKKVFFVCPISKGSAVNVCFLLSDGTTTNKHPMTLLDDYEGVDLTDTTGLLCNIWEADIPGTVIAKAGTVKVQFFITDTESKVLATPLSEFTVEEGVAATAPTETDSYDDLIALVSRLNTTVENLKSAFNGNLEAEGFAKTVTAFGVSYTSNTNGEITIPAMVGKSNYTVDQKGLITGLDASQHFIDPNSPGLLKHRSSEFGWIDSRLSGFGVITPGQLNYAVTAALTDAKHIVLTDAQKVTAKSVLGITASEDTPTKLYKHMIEGYLTLNGEQYNFSRWECWSPSNTAFGVNEVFDLLYTQPCFIGSLGSSSYVGMILGRLYGHICCWSQGTNKIDYFTVTKNDITVTSDTVTEL